MSHMSLTDEVKSRQLAVIERMLNRLASEVGGNAKFHAERVAALVEEIELLRNEFGGLRNDLKGLVGRVDRMAEFLTKLKQGNGNDSAKAG